MLYTFILWSQDDLNPFLGQGVSYGAAVTLSLHLAYWGQPSKGRAFSWPMAFAGVPGAA